MIKNLYICMFYKWDWFGSWVPYDIFELDYAGMCFQSSQNLYLSFNFALLDRLQHFYHNRFIIRDVDSSIDLGIFPLPNFLHDLKLLNIAS